MRKDELSEGEEESGDENTTQKARRKQVECIMGDYTAE